MLIMYRFSRSRAHLVQNSRATGQNLWELSCKSEDWTRSCSPYAHTQGAKPLCISRTLLLRRCKLCNRKKNADPGSRSLYYPAISMQILPDLTKRCKTNLDLFLRNSTTPGNYLEFPLSPKKMYDVRQIKANLGNIRKSRRHFAEYSILQNFQHVEFRAVRKCARNL